MSSHEHTDDEDTTTARRMPIAALALLGLSMWAGVTFTDKATGGWAVAFVIFGGVVLVLAAALWITDAAQARGITPDTNDDTDDTDRSNNDG